MKQEVALPWAKFSKMETGRWPGTDGQVGTGGSQETGQAQRVTRQRPRPCPEGCGLAPCRELPPVAVLSWKQPEAVVPSFRRHRPRGRVTMWP